MLTYSDLWHGILFSICFIQFGNVVFQSLGCVLGNFVKSDLWILRVKMNGCFMKWEEHVGLFSCRKRGVIRRSDGRKKGLKTASELHFRSWSISCRSVVG